MLTMNKKNSIRESFFVNGKSITDISRDTGHDRKTIRRVISTEYWNEATPTAQEVSLSKLDPYVATHSI